MVGIIKGFDDDAVRVKFFFWGGESCFEMGDVADDSVEGTFADSTYDNLLLSFVYDAQQARFQGIADEISELERSADCEVIFFDIVICFL